MRRIIFIMLSFFMCNVTVAHENIILGASSEPCDMSNYPLKSINNNQVISIHKMEIHPKLLYEPNNVELVLDGEVLHLNKQYFKIDDLSNYVYSAYESENAYAYFSKLGDNILGVINSIHGTYYIDTSDNGEYYLLKIDADEIGDEGNPITPHEAFGIDFTDRVLGERVSEKSTIRVLVMYTAEAATIVSDMKNKVYAEINNGNNSFINSNVNAEFELAYLGQTTDSETGKTFSELLYNYRDTNDGFVDEVHDLRQRYAADVCVLLVKNSEYCGYAFIGSSYGNAFSVVHASSGCQTKYSFTHEIGHNIGCRHDTIVDASNFPYEYGHGFVHYTGNSSNSWRTMMAYGNACSGESHCARICYWSNPDVYYNNSPTGTSLRCNNARVWNENAPYVSSFSQCDSNIIVSNLDNDINMKYASWKTSESIVAGNGYIVGSGQTVDMKAGKSITLQPNTTIERGAVFSATTKE